MEHAVQVRDAEAADMADIQSIYAHHVLHGLATFEEVPPSIAEMTNRRAAVLGAGLPYLAAEAFLLVQYLSVRDDARDFRR